MNVLSMYLWPQQEAVQILLCHVISIRPSIQFTMGKENNNQLAFLDVLITCIVNGFKTSVYHKPTFTKQYLNFNSHYPCRKDSLMSTTPGENNVATQTRTNKKWEVSNMPLWITITQQIWPQCQQGVWPENCHSLSTLCQKRFRRSVIHTTSGQDSKAVKSLLSKA